MTLPVVAGSRSLQGCCCLEALAGVCLILRVKSRRRVLSVQAHSLRGGKFKRLSWFFPIGAHHAILVCMEPVVFC